MTFVKICGITHVADALAAAAAGADALGFVFAPSPRRITPRQAAAISAMLPPGIRTFGVFVDEEEAFVRDVAVTVGLDHLQFHGRETPEYVQRFGGRGVKAWRVRDESVLTDIPRYGGGLFVLDGPGGGRPFAWEIAVRARSCGPFLLAGGLTPENIVAALERVRPFGVDASSGVESSPGRKDREKMIEWIRRIRIWDHTMENSGDSAAGSCRKR